ncbi:hypothetical protein SAMN05443634_104131 [Chishuiella changwenlii]|uniref:Carbohydrate binding domain-containing protein n=2 Tax=Chishuiella changwenlii TaxID=1434701 RepID=A0A1M6W232_9FLAO|nr:hypothetical protein [Chishuiella changwenlii]SHK87804.1 hypothetical protein SAMN05443634_104131 [Chishuiella changwenlii]
MKKNLLFFCLFMMIELAYSQSTNKIIFSDDFGKSTKRIGSQYIPQSGKDRSLGTFDSHGSSFYQLADKYFQVAPNPQRTDRKRANQDVWNIDNGYYAVIAPKSIYNFNDPIPDMHIDWRGDFWRSIVNHTDSSDDGAVLVVNGGTILNQYYRRAILVESGKSYKISAWFYGSNNNNVGVNFEVQDIVTEEILGSSNKDLGILPHEYWTNSETNLKEQNKWEKMSWTFKVPQHDTSHTIAVALRNNIIANQGNDFYVDDITLEEVSSGGNTIDSPSNSDVDNVIKANDDYISPTKETASYDIIMNDSYNNETGNIVLSGSHKNSTISTTGTWPTGITLDTATGQITIKNDAVIPSDPLTYQLCNTLGVCSAAKIFLTSTSSCTQDPKTGTPTGYTLIGISTLSKTENFPLNIPNGILALQSTNKGFVISRTSSDKILTPIEGMLIYDTTKQCVKLYNGSSWNCIKKSCNN